MNNKIIIIAVFLILAIGGCSTLSTYIGYKNEEVTLRNLAETKQENIANSYDAMWKIISQKAQISTEYKNSFDSIYSHIMGERYSKGDGSLMKWVTESNPQFDMSLYRDLSNTVESQRLYFRNEQADLLNIAMQHKNLIQKFPGSFFLSGKEPIKVKLITSAKTKEVVRSGEDNDVDLFSK
jgi:hypothetical protein